MGIIFDCDLSITDSQAGGSLVFYVHYEPGGMREPALSLPLIGKKENNFTNVNNLICRSHRGFCDTPVCQDVCATGETPSNTKQHSIIIIVKCTTWQSSLVGNEQKQEATADNRKV